MIVRLFRCEQPALKRERQGVALVTPQREKSTKFGVNVALILLM